MKNFGGWLTANPELEGGHAPPPGCIWGGRTATPYAGGGLRATPKGGYGHV
jgi:hypothetical protein